MPSRGPPSHVRVRLLGVRDRLHKMGHAWRRRMGAAASRGQGSIAGADWLWRATCDSGTHGDGRGQAGGSCLEAF